MGGQDAEGICALHWAALQGHAGMVQLLLSCGAYPNSMEVNGNKSTPLDYAVHGAGGGSGGVVSRAGGAGPLAAALTRTVAGFACGRGGQATTSTARR